MSLNNNKENFMTRIKAAWLKKSRRAKLVYIFLFVICIIFMAMCIWSIAEVDATRRMAYNQFKPLIDQQTGLMNDPIWGKVYNDKFKDRGLHVFCWFVASKPEFNKLSSSLYILCPISMIIVAPILVYILSSILVVGFPRKTKEEKELIKQSKLNKKGDN